MRLSQQDQRKKAENCERTVLLRAAWYVRKKLVWVIYSSSAPQGEILKKHTN